MAGIRGAEAGGPAHSAVVSPLAARAGARRAGRRGRFRSGDRSGSQTGTRRHSPGRRPAASRHSGDSRRTLPGPRTRSRGRPSGELSPSDGRRLAAHPAETAHCWPSLRGLRSRFGSRFTIPQGACPFPTNPAARGPFPATPLGYHLDGARRGRPYPDRRVAPRSGSPSGSGRGPDRPRGSRATRQPPMTPEGADPDDRPHARSDPGHRPRRGRPRVGQPEPPPAGAFPCTTRWSTPERADDLVPAPPGGVLPRRGRGRDRPRPSGVRLRHDRTWRSVAASYPSTRATSAWAPWRSWAPAWPLRGRPPPPDAAADDPNAEQVPVREDRVPHVPAG